MDRLTDNAQGYCEMYCDSYNSCFNPDNCKKQKEIAIYEKLRDYENSDLTPVKVRTHEINEQEKADCAENIQR